jgi:hypothetical protein
MGKIISEVEKRGYFDQFYIEREELIFLSRIIGAQLIKRMPTSKLATHTGNAEEVFENYMEMASEEDHKNIESKSNRILDEKTIPEFLGLNFIEALKRELGDFSITSEDRLGTHEIYWRLVRPNRSSDIGPLHADEWFWRLNYETDPFYSSKRLKIWIPIYAAHDEYGFKYIPYSHNAEHKYSTESRGSKVRGEYKGPTDGILYHKGAPGNAIIFHDKLIHGGAVGKKDIRISLEFTVAVKDGLKN